jgi:subtilisin family serine protease
MRRLLVGVLACVASLALAWGELEGQPTPAHSSGSAQADATIVPGQYIVVFHDDVDPFAIADQVLVKHGRVLRTYAYAIKGCAVRLTPEAADELSRHPSVAYVEPDRYGQLAGTQPNPPNWGLDRIDQVDLPLDNSYTYGNDASGIDIYILDTGVRSTHNDFGGRVQFVPNGSNGDFVGDGHGSAEDCHGHGTHVAGVAAGAAHGVAKGATIWAARIIDCIASGYLSTALEAVDWITANAQHPAVVNISLGWPATQSLTDAVENSIAAGFTYVTAASGSIVPMDACSWTPGNAPNAITVGATNSNDVEVYFSNWGTCVDLLAPGGDILSAGHLSDNATEIMSGTSMAAPHVAGTAALYLCWNPRATPAEVATALVHNAVEGVIDLHDFSLVNGTPNLLLNVSSIGACGAGLRDDPPTVAAAIPDTTVAENNQTITAYCDLNCVFHDAEEGTRLNFTVLENSNPGLVNPVINAVDSTLDLNFLPDVYGSATLVIRATDSRAQTVDESFMVAVTPVPERSALHQNVPNPFNPSTTIHFDLVTATAVDLLIYDVSGRLVRTLVNYRMPRGEHQFEWDGLNDRGVRVTAGVYFYRLVTSEFRVSKKMTFLSRGPADRDLHRPR